MWTAVGLLLVVGMQAEPGKVPEDEMGDSAPRDRAVREQVKPDDSDPACRSPSLQSALEDLQIAEEQLRKASTPWDQQLARRTVDVYRDMQRQALQSQRECEERHRAERAEAKAREEAEGAHAKDLERRKSDPAVLGIAYSALICVRTVERAEALKEIAQEKRYSQIGGVKNNAKLYALQQRIRTADEQIADFRKPFNRAKQTPLPCTDPKVAAVSACIRASFEDCPVDAMRYAEVLLQ